MDEETNGFHFPFYLGILLHGVADAAIVFIPVCIVALGCHLLVTRFWGSQPLVERILQTLAFLTILGTGIRAARIRYRAGLSARRRSFGQCLHCGYDLRASTDHCPECGRSIRAARYGGPA